MCEIVTRYLTYNSGSDRLGREILTSFASAKLRGRLPAGRDGRVLQRIGTQQHACWHRAQHACCPRDLGPVVFPPMFGSVRHRQYSMLAGTGGFSMLAGPVDSSQVFCR